MNQLPGLLKIILVTLPLTASVTLPVGFPLKIYELVGVVALVQLAAGPVRLGGRSRVPLLWLVFWFGTLFPIAYGLPLILGQHGTMLEWATGRYHPVANTVFHYVYLGFDIGLLVLVVQVLGSGKLSGREFARYWLIGSCVAVIYAVLLNVVYRTGVSPQLLLRWHKLQFMPLAGFTVVRTGPFQEGNFFGLYLLLSMTMALWGSQQYRDRFFNWMVPGLGLGASIPASPAAILGVLILVGIAVLLGGGSPPVRLVIICGGIAVLVFLFESGLLANFLDKFSLIIHGTVANTHNVSLLQRLNQSYHAWLMFLDNPWGVGIGNYGYLFGQYPDLFTWLTSDFSGTKLIVNNIYLEVLTEHGIILFTLFMYILGFMAQRLLVARRWLILTGYALLCAYFFAFPTFRLAFIWVFWGFLVWSGRPLSSAREPVPTVDA